MSPLPVPPPASVSLEQFAEPMTGWAMLGAGGRWPGEPYPGPLTVEVDYDGVRRLTDAVRQTPAGDRAEYHFGTQLPVEPGVQRVTVRLAGGGGSAVLFDGPAAEALRPRGGPAPAPAAGGSRLPSPVRTLGRAVASGDVLAGRWWADRATRYREKAFTLRQRVRDKLHARAGGGPRTVHDAYVADTRLSGAEWESMRQRAAGFRHRPTVSLLCPVFNAPRVFLNELVSSVLNQSYPQWELVLADDASTDPATVAALNRLPSDPRIKLVRRPTNGHICAATNSAAAAATGEFVAFLDNDDRLAPQALVRVVELLQAEPDIDIVYSDEDKLDPTGRRYDPQFKPDWSPDLLLSYNYVNHLTVMRRQLFEAVGRLRAGYEGAQDYDLLLRATERTDRVRHVPEILYHWRAHAGSTATAAGQKPYVATAARKALTDALTRRGVSATAYTPPFAERLGLPVAALDGPDDGPAVAVIVRGEAAAAARTARAVRATTSYTPHTVYLVIDAAVPAEALNRHAAGRTEEFLLFLDAGVEPADPRWLSRLLAHARLSGVGAVGGLVARSDGTVVSAGTVLGDGGRPADAFAGVKPDPVSYYFLAECTRTVSAPAAGCLLVRREHFERAGGFDADRYGRSLYDLDLCRRLAGLGLRAVHVGGARLTNDAPDAGRHDAPTEVRAFGRGPDPFDNPNLDRFAPRPGGPRPAPLPPAVPVLFGTHNLSATEGAPKVIRDVAVGLHAAGAVRATLFAPAPGPAAGGLPALADDTPFGRRFLDGKWTPTEYAAALRHLRAVLRRSGAEAVVANTVGLFPLVEAAIRAGRPSVLCVQETYPPGLRAALFSPYARWRLEWAMRHAGRVLFPSRDCRAAYADLGLGNAEVVPNGLDPAPIDAYLREAPRADPEAGLRPAGFRVVAVGTVCERKAQHVLVEAAAVLAGTRRDFAVHLVGGRAGLPYHGYVAGLIAARGLADVVDLVPETPDVWRYLRAADVYVCTSHVEGYSLSVLEGLAFGLPVVSTRCGGVAEQVSWGHNAIPVGFDDPAGLAAALGRLMADPPLLQRMRAEARAGFDALPDAAAVAAGYARVLAAAVRAARC